MRTPLSRRISHTDVRNPGTAAAATTIMLSVNNWRTMRARLAPSARRTAISLRLPAARASIMLPTLAHAISMIKPDITVKNEVKKGRSCLRRGSILPPSTSCTRRPFCVLAASPFSCSICCAVASSSASTREFVTPGRRRPTMRKMVRSRRSSAWPAKFGRHAFSHRKRHPKIGSKEDGRRAEKFFRPHSDHGGRLRIDAQRLADRRWIGGQLLLPESVTDHHGRHCSRPLFRVKKAARAPDERPAWRSKRA